MAEQDVMNAVVTPEPAGHSLTLEDLMADLHRTFELVSGDTSADSQLMYRWAHWIGMGAYMIAGVLWINRNKLGIWIDGIGVILLILGTVLFIVFTVGNAWSIRRDLKALHATTFRSLGSNLTQWHSAIARLRSTYAKDQIIFAGEYVSGVASQLRGRVGHMIGALDKVGLFPLVISAGFTAYAGLKNEPLHPLLALLPVVVGVFYIVTFRFISLAYRLDQVVMLLKHAASDPPSE